MTQLKRWESPRREGRNSKGKGGSARQRQLKKQTQMLRKKLKQNSGSDKQKSEKQRGSGQTTPFLFWNMTHQNVHPNRLKTFILIVLRCNSGDCFRMESNESGQSL
jgi:hypothetical protein